MLARYHRFLYLSFFLSLFIVLSLSFTSLLESRRLAVEKLKASYHSAIATSKLQLSEALHTLAADPGIMAKLQKKLSHSLKQALDAELRPGSLDALLVVDTDCRVISKATLLPISLEGLCQKHPSSALRWTWAAEHPGLTLALPVAHTGYHLLALQHLSPLWLASFPALAAAAKRQRLAWGQPKDGSYPIVKEAVEGSNASATFFFTRAVDNYFGLWINRQEPIPASFTLPLAILALISLAFFLLLDYRYRRRLRGIEGQIITWSQDPLNPGKAPPSDDNSYHAVAERNVIAYFLETAEELASTRANLEHKHKEQISLRQELRECRQELAKARPYSVLAHSVDAAADSLASKIHSFRKHSSDIAYFLKDGVLPVNEQLHQIGQRWRQGIAKRGGVRQFIRVLVESEGANNRSRLEEDVELILSYTDALAKMSLRALSSAQMLARKKTDVAELVTAWHAIAKDCGQQQHAFDWGKILSWSILVAAIEGRARLTMQSSIESIVTYSPMSVGHAFAMMHALVQAILTRSSAERACELSISTKVHNKQELLVLSLYDAKKRLQSLELTSPMFQWSMQIASSFGIDMKLLLAAEGGHHLVLSNVIFANKGSILASPTSQPNP